MGMICPEPCFVNVDSAFLLKTTIYWFKRTFGRDISKRLMILVLREIIPEIDIQDITYTNKEHPNPFPNDHGVVFDIECKSSDGTRFIVEMQLAEQHYLMERAPRRS